MSKHPGARLTVVLAALALVASTAIMMNAALGMTDHFPLGKQLDVPIAIVLFLLMLSIRKASGGRVDEHAQSVSYRVAIHFPALVLLSALPFADGMVWYIFIIGMAWRSWLFLYALPFAITAWRPSVEQ